MAARVRLLGWTHTVFGATGVAVAAAFLAAIALRWDPEYERIVGWVAPVALVAELAWFAPSLAGGVGLLIGRPWARAVLWVQTPLLLLFFPVGTVLAGFTMWVLMPDPNGDLAAQHARWEQSTQAWVRRFGGLVVAALAAIGLLGAMIGLGYLFRDQIETAPSLDGMAKPIAFGVGLLFAVGIGLFGKARRLPPMTAGQWGRRSRGKRDQTEQQRAYDRRLAEFEADPVRRMYAARMRAGEDWSDEQIAYDQDRTQTRTCKHLAPVERAMRDAGLWLRHVVGMHVRAQCRIDEAGLRAGMRLAPSLVYSEDDNRGRLHEEPLGASLSCRLCNSAIRTTDPWEWREETAVFPRKD